MYITYMLQLVKILMGYYAGLLPFLFYYSQHGPLQICEAEITELDIKRTASQPQNKVWVHGRPLWVPPITSTQITWSNFILQKLDP
jgi:hypothetical protein